MYDATLAETVTIHGHDNHEIEAYVARPMSPGPLGGVVVIHHLPGYDEPTKDMARTFAVHGYNAVMPNLYHRDAPGASPDVGSGSGPVATYHAAEPTYHT
jgi:carboxymethylenebutenolidase